MSEDNNKLPVFNPSEAIREGLAILDEAGARFALAGCLAAWSYVPPEGKRLTQDVDFAVRSADMEAVLDAARRRGHAVEKLGAGGHRITVGGVPVDFIDGRPYLLELFEFAVAHARKMDLGLGEGVPVVRRDDLVAMKAAAAGEQDEQDIRWILKAVCVVAVVGGLALLLTTC